MRSKLPPIVATFLLLCCSKYAFAAGVELSASELNGVSIDAKWTNHRKYYRSEELRGDNLDVELAINVSENVISVSRTYKVGSSHRR